MAGKTSSKPRKSAADRKIDAQIRRERKARSAQAVGAENAPETVEIGGVVFHQPTLSHMWFYNRLSQCGQAMPTLIDFAVCIVAASTMPAKECRNTLFGAIDRGDAVAVCYERVVALGIDSDLVNEVYVRLWQPWVESRKAAAEGNATSREDSSPAGGEK